MSMRHRGDAYKIIEILNMKNIIRITESELKRLIIEAVKKSLTEGIRINRTKEGNFVTFDDSENGLIDGPVVGEITLPQSNLKPAFPTIT